MILHKEKRNKGNILYNAGINKYFYMCELKRV